MRRFQRKGWWLTLANNKAKTKYIILLVVFTVIFFISMVICIGAYGVVSANFRYRSVDGRMDALKLDEKMMGYDHIYSDLYFGKDYEKEFDSYWEFADIYQIYVKGRFADDPTDAINKLQAYADNCKDQKRAEKALEYIDIIKNGKN